MEQLREIANRNSQNSSQPPSQDRPDQKPVKEPSGPPHKWGGQPGHRGHHRVLVDDVDKVMVYKPISCVNRGTLLLGEDPAPYRLPVSPLNAYENYLRVPHDSLTINSMGKTIDVDWGNEISRWEIRNWIA